MQRSPGSATRKRFPFPQARPAPRMAAGPPPAVHEQIVWQRTVSPRERYRIVYLGSDKVESERTVELLRIGTWSGHTYLGVNDESDGGRFKTMRVDRVLAVLEQLTAGHEPSIRPFPTYATVLPTFPLPGAVYKIPTTASHGDTHKTWTVDLNAYTCTCPEKRRRAAKGYQPGELGAVCDHMAKAILGNLPEDYRYMGEHPDSRLNRGWTPELLSFLQDSRRIHISSLR